MAQSRLVAICQAIADHIDKQPFDLTVAAERFNMAFMRRENLSSSTPTCIVSPGGLTQAIETRGRWGGQYDVEIVLIQAFETNDLAAQDALINLCEQVPLTLIDGVFAGAQLVVIDDESVRTVFEEAQWETSSLYYSTSTVTLRDGGY